MLTSRFLFALGAAASLAACGSEPVAPSAVLKRGVGTTNGGQSGTTLIAEKTVRLDWRCEAGTEVLYLVGEITVTNAGGIATENLTITDTPQFRVEGDNTWTDLSSFDVPTTELAAGETRVYPYEVLVPFYEEATYRNTVLVTITNHSGSIGTPKGPNPKSSIAGGDIPVGVCGDGGCTLSQGWYKTHPNDWDVASLDLGTVGYSQAQLLSILNTPVGGNGLISLAHQLIAAKLNVLFGADPTDAAQAIADADALIGSLVVPPVGSDVLAPAAVGALVTALSNYNTGVTGPGHCGSEE